MAPRTPSGACVCWAGWGFASGQKRGCAAGQTHAGPLSSRYGVEIGSSTSITGPSIPARTREVLVSHLASYHMWALQGAWCFLWAMEGGHDGHGVQSPGSPEHWVGREDAVTRFMDWHAHPSQEDVAVSSSGASIPVPLSQL